MIRVLYLVPSLKRRGPTNQLLNIIRNLPRNKFIPSVVALSKTPGDDSFVDEFEQANISVRELGVGRFSGIYRSGVVKRVSNEIKPDVVHTQGLRADRFGQRLARDVPHVATIRNVPWEDYPAKFGRVVGTAMAIAQTRSFKSIQTPIACSRSISDAVAKRGVMAEVIENGVDTEKFTPAPETVKQGLLNDLGLPLDKKIVLSVGSLISRKDPTSVIRGFSQSKLAKDALLVLLGDGPLREVCEQESTSHPNILIKGDCKNVVDYLRVGDIFLSASHSEGLPNAVLEAMAVGLQCCVSDIPSHKEIFGNEPGVVVYFSVGSKMDIANALDRVSSMISTDHKMRVRQITQQRFSDKVMSLKYQRLYSELVGV